GLVPGAPLPAPEAVDRQLWAEINLAGMRKMLDPFIERLESRRSGMLGGPLRGVAGALLALEVGGLTGLLSQRVLGQYELVLLDPDSRTRLLFLAPNLREAAGRLNVDLEQLVAWVGFHEVTHAVQFTSVPWLRDHLAGLLRELLASVDLEFDPRAAMRRLPTRDDLERLLGLELKLRQYQVGKRFCDTVAEREGVEALHRVFDGPESLPTWAELEDPDSWIARVLRPAA